MLKSIKHLILIGSFSLLTACGFSFQNNGLVPEALHNINLESSDPYSEMARAVRHQLQINNINIVEGKKDIPVLRLNKTRTEEKVASIFKRGREAEKVLILEVEAAVRLPNQESHQISAKVNRTFFDNSRAALAKSAEKDVIWNDMREQAARQLIVKMAALQKQVQAK